VNHLGRQPSEYPSDNVSLSLSSPTVSLHVATPDEASLLANLLELYIHDLSAAFPSVVLGPDGRFGYPELPRYWAEPDRRFPYLIRVDENVAGFALVSRGSPAVEDPDVWDVTEFFVLRRFRGMGVGRRAAALLWRRLEGRWVVRVSQANPAALPFWSHVVEAAAPGRVSTFVHRGKTAPWNVFVFAPQAPAPPG